MQNLSLFSRIAAAVFCLLFVHCATTQAPRHWLTEPGGVPYDVHGAWIDIDIGTRSLGGELIAVAKDTIFFVDTAFNAIASADIRSARLVVYDAENLGYFIPIGTALTITNGFFLVLTAPMWIVGGTIAAVARSHDPILDFPMHPLAEFAPFARFPQGLPGNLDRSRVKMKTLSDAK